jgi:DNA-directed RNA polymerase subunit RPC12/RpoP
MTVDEINEAVRKALAYDDYKYQKEAGIRITEEFRAEGMHKILYQCPHCMTESKMASKGAELFCEACGKRWTLNEDGTLAAQTGDTEFSHVPDWFEWQREQVKRQIAEGTYSFEDEVEVYSLPRFWKFEKLGQGKLVHDPEQGFVLEGFYRDKPYRIHRMPHQSNSLHIEYDYCYLRPEDCVDISTESDSFYCYPVKQNVVTKMAFATEELYRLSQEKGKKKQAKAEKVNTEE